jgi:DNA-binding LacI/PurR family transcriptional regulator
LSTPDRPRAIFAGSHLKAVGVLRAAQELGLSVPDDVALIGFDDMPWAPFLAPPLTVVKQPVVEMATDAVERLIQRINVRFGPEQDRNHELVEQRLYRPKLIIRKSCGYNG